MFKLLTFITLLCFSVVSSQEDYCKVGLCPDDSVHIACGNSGDWYQNCVNPIQVEMTPLRQQLLVSAQNVIRNKVALGNQTGFVSAARMLPLQWNDILASFAELNTKQCRLKFDQCHNTDDFEYTGQNIGVQCTAGVLNVDVSISTILNTWISKASAICSSDIESFKPETNGIFTQIIQDKASRVGCAASTYKNGKNNCLLLVCNYNFANIFYESVYTPGPSSKRCSVAGVNIDYAGLCPYAEYVIPKPF